MVLGIDIAAFRGSKVPRETIQAYLDTDFHICSVPEVILRIGQRSDEVIKLYEKYSVLTAAILTAWNPHSELHSAAENEIAQASLTSQIELLGLRHQPASGADPTGRWPPEPSRFVLGIDLKTAQSMGRKFRQNGIVSVAADGVPMLVMLR